MNNKIKTLKELKNSGYKAIGIKDEMKKNLRLNNKVKFVKDQK